MARGISKKEIRWSRRARIPLETIEKMVRGLKLDEEEEFILNTKGKVYVMGHMRNGTWVRAQLRDMPKLEIERYEKKGLSATQIRMVSEAGVSREILRKMILGKELSKPEAEMVRYKLREFEEKQGEEPQFEGIKIVGGKAVGTGIRIPLR